MYVLLLELLPVAKCHAQIWKFKKKWAFISEPAARRTKNKLHFDHVERECVCNFWNICQWPRFMPKYEKFLNVPQFFSETAARRAKIKLHFDHVE